jgi:hypothetical protein
MAQVLELVKVFRLPLGAAAPVPVTPGRATGTAAGTATVTSYKASPRIVPCSCDGLLINCVRLTAGDASVDGGCGMALKVL